MYANANDYLNLENKPRSSLVSRTYLPHESHYTPQPDFTMKWNTQKITNTADPKVWGPAFWFTLHNSAVHYPEKASPIVKERMKWRILALPYEIPCHTCRSHASAFIEKHKEDLDNIVSGKHSLGKFYVDFHNQVNKRYGKPEWTYEQAHDYYSGNADVLRVLNYK